MGKYLGRIAFQPMQDSIYPEFLSGGTCMLESGLFGFLVKR